MEYYSTRPTEAASEFESAFGLAPLGEDVTAERLARLEAIAGLFVTAAVDPLSRRARIWIGSFAPGQTEVPVPSEEAIGKILDQFRTTEETAARRAAQFSDL